ncbi:Hypothetical_protein [Hexamita inflata]|uniref:Hypothetical_protein n=1 Tax=Hexamita inflata TaxID=28002 RepID=A0AA86UH45_9EUKA|nr:Hypothetical protein HINF_LOCUS45570 [Hexamita inflata]
MCQSKIYSHRELNPVYKFLPINDFICSEIDSIESNPFQTEAKTLNQKMKRKIFFEPENKTVHSKQLSFGINVLRQTFYFDLKYSIGTKDIYKIYLDQLHQPERANGESVRRCDV